MQFAGGVGVRANAGARDSDEQSLQVTLLVDRADPKEFIGKDRLTDKRLVKIYFDNVRFIVSLSARL